METKAQFSEFDLAWTFLHAGRAYITLVSKKSGDRFTYRVARPDPSKPFFVSLLTGPDNTRSYSFFGCVFSEDVFRFGKNSSIGRDSKGAQAFKWFWEYMVAHRAIPSTVEVYHEGRCARCGRALTTPESIRAGIGPVCSSIEAF
jgi:hypothetical protein